MADNHWSAHLESFLGERHGRGGGWLPLGSQERAAGVLCWGVCRHLKFSNNGPPNQGKFCGSRPRPTPSARHVLAVQVLRPPSVVDAVGTSSWWFPISPVLSGPSRARNKLCRPNGESAHKHGSRIFVSFPRSRFELRPPNRARPPTRTLIPTGRN